MRSGPVLRAILSVALAIAIFISLTLLIISTWLSQTIFSPDYYQVLITRSEYLPLLRQTIEQDLQAQASYATVPDEVLLAGVNNDTIHLQLRQHVVNFAMILSGEIQPVAADSTNPDEPAHSLSYPAQFFYEPLLAYLHAHNRAAGLSTTPDQLAAIQAVSEQAAQTVLTHVILVDPTSILAIRPVQQVLVLLRQLAGLSLPVTAALSLLLLLAAILTIRDLRDNRERKRHRPSGGSHSARAKIAQSNRHTGDPLVWARATLNSCWIAASLFLVPTLVLQTTDLISRLAIQTGYLKFALTTLSSRANLLLIVWSGTIFIFVTIALIALERLAKSQN